MRNENKQKEKKEYLLYVYTLGKFEIYADDSLLTEGYKRSNRMWNLFKYILSNKDRLIPPEELIENLWRNDETKSNLSKSLQNLMFRLRRSLYVKDQPDDIILFTKGCYKWNEDYPVWVDVDILEDYHKRGTEYKNTSIHEARYCFERAIVIYTGEYFNDVFYNNWIVAHRVKYYNMYIECVNSLLHIMDHLNNFEAVLRICTHVFEYEKSDPKINLAYIKALYMTQKTEEALKYYDHATLTMYKEYGIKPDESYRELFTLISSKSDATYFDIDGVMKILNEDMESTGAFVCEKDTFIAVNKVLLRNIERSGISIMIIPVSLASAGKNLKGAKSMKDAVEASLQFFAVSLRKSDAVCVWGKDMLCLMLTNLTFEDSESVLKEIKENLENEVLNGKYSVSYKIYPLEKSLN